MKNSAVFVLAVSVFLHSTDRERPPGVRSVLRSPEWRYAAAPHLHHICSTAAHCIQPELSAVCVCVCLQKRESSATQSSPCGSVFCRDPLMTSWRCFWWTGTKRKSATMWVFWPRLQTNNRLAVSSNSPATIFTMKKSFVWYYKYSMLWDTGSKGRWLCHMTLLILGARPRYSPSSCQWWLKLEVGRLWSIKPEP